MVSILRHSVTPILTHHTGRGIRSQRRQHGTRPCCRTTRPCRRRWPVSPHTLTSTSTFPPTSNNLSSNWEGFTNDPYLDGQLVFETIRGMQESTIACVKHFVAYEQETNRQVIGMNASVSSNLDDRTMHELYLWPFQDALHAGESCG